MSGVTKDTSQLRSTASRASQLRDRIRHLGSDLDSAMGPARRSDVPELGEIDATYGPLRSRIANMATTMDMQARYLRSYADRSDSVEQLNMWFLRTPNLPYVIAGKGAGAPKLDLKRLLQGTFEEAGWDALKRITEVTPTSGATAAIRAFSKNVPLLSVMLGIDAWQRADSQERVGIGLSMTATGLKLAADFDALLVNAGARTALSGGLATAASRGPVVAAGYAIGTPIGNYYREWFEHNDQKGASNLQAIISRQDIPGPSGLNVKAAEVGLLGVYKSSEWLGQKYYGVEEPAVYLDDHKAAVVVAHFREVFGPAVHLKTEDGKYTVMIPSDIPGMPAQHFTFDNKTGKQIK